MDYNVLADDARVLDLYLRRKITLDRFDPSGGRICYWVPV